MEDRKFSLSIRVLENNGYHVRFGMHSGMIPADMLHTDTNRALCGFNATMRNNEFIPFLRHVKPHLIYDVVVTEDQPVTLVEYFKLLGIEDKTEETVQPLNDKLLYLLEQTKETEILAKEQAAYDLENTLYVSGVEIGREYTKLFGTA